MTEFPYPDTCLIIFSKAPVPGQCKTRLIPALGEQGAAQLQEELLERCIKQLCAHPLCETQLWCTPDTGHGCFQSLAEKYVLHLQTQQGEGLGEKMYHAMSRSSSTYTLIVGTDIPLLSRDYVEQAICLLHEGMDAVIGPVEDGGYGLLGLQRIEPRLFEGINWGTDAVTRQTGEILTALGLSWQSLQNLWDVDNARDLARYRGLTSCGQENTN